MFNSASSLKSLMAKKSLYRAASNMPNAGFFTVASKASQGQGQMAQLATKVGRMFGVQPH
jgi:hypothetical protein